MNFYGGKGWPIWQISGDLPNLPSKLVNDVHNRESKQAGIHQSFTRQKLLMENSPVFLHQTFVLYSNFSFTSG